MERITYLVRKPLSGKPTLIQTIIKERHGFKFDAWAEATQLKTPLIAICKDLTDGKVWICSPRENTIQIAKTI